MTKVCWDIILINPTAQSNLSGIQIYAWLAQAFTWSKVWCSFDLIYKLNGLIQRMEQWSQWIHLYCIWETHGFNYGINYCNKMYFHWNHCCIFLQCSTVNQLPSHFEGFVDLITYNVKTWSQEDIHMKYILPFMFGWTLLNASFHSSKLKALSSPKLMASVLKEGS